MRIREWHTAKAGKWLLVTALWLLWLGMAGWLTINPVFYLTPLLGLLTHVLLSAISTEEPQELHQAQPKQIDTSNGQVSNLKHDLLTPIRLIISFCDVLNRANQTGQLTSFTITANLETIRLNAQKLEGLVTSLFTPSANAVNTPELQPQVQTPLESLLHEALKLTADLTANRDIPVKLEVIAPLPSIMLNRTYALQAMLNLIRSIAQPAPSSTLDSLSIVAKVEKGTVRIAFTTSTTRIQHTAASSNWSITERLIEKLAGQVRIESGSDRVSTIVISLPLTDQILDTPTIAESTQPPMKQKIIVIADEEPVIELFYQWNNMYDVIVVPEVDAIVFGTIGPPNQLLGVISTREREVNNETVQQKIANLVGAQVPIVDCFLPGPEQQLRALRATYLAKPIDYDALMDVLAKFQLDNQSILLVEDNLDTTTILTRMLASMPAQYDVQKAHTAHAALSILDAPNHKIGAVIVDISLPDMDGIQWVTFLRTIERFVELPVILMSAHETLDFMLDRHATRRISIYPHRGIEAKKLVRTIGQLLNIFEVPTD